jgi:hypothetical protein
VKFLRRLFERRPVEPESPPPTFKPAQFGVSGPDVPQHDYTPLIGSQSIPDNPPPADDELDEEIEAAENEGMPTPREDE